MGAEEPADALLAGIGAEGIGVYDRFVGDAGVRALLECARLRRQRGDFLEARIGAGAAAVRRADIRGDSICWLTEPLHAPERELLARLDELRIALNRRAYLGLVELEAHYAWYPAGAGYARHVDQPKGRNARRVSMVLYLNEGWSSADGGLLRCEGDDGAAREIEPVGGRLVVFLSAGREHEVLPAARDRVSVTGWFRGEEGPLR